MLRAYRHIVRAGCRAGLHKLGFTQVRGASAVQLPAACSAYWAGRTMNCLSHHSRRSISGTAMRHCRPADASKPDEDKKSGDEKFSADTPFSYALWYVTLGSAVSFAAYLGFRGWTDYFSPSAKEDAEAAVRAIPLIQGNPVVFLDLAFEGQDLGRVILQLRKDQAPKTSENFRRLCTGERGFGLRGCRFHALVPGSYMAGGDIVHGTGEGGKSALGIPFPPEKNELRHIGPGILSMAGPGPDYTSQFAISLGKGPLMDGKFPTFGNVIEGFETLKAAEEAIQQHQKLAKAGDRRPALIVKDCGQLMTTRRQ